MERKYDLICFDLDRTLIEEKNGDILWERISRLIHGNSEMSKKRHALYNKGELKVEDWCDIDLGEWKEKGLTKEILAREAKHSRLNYGVKETLEVLKKYGFKLAIISGSIDILLETVFPDHPFEEVFINRLFFDDKGKLASWEKMTGANEDKGKSLRKIAEKEGIPLSRTVFIGDNLNDISAAKIAGLSIAFNSNIEEFKKECDVIILKKDMREILKHII